MDLFLIVSYQGNPLDSLAFCGGHAVLVGPSCCLPDPAELPFHQVNGKYEDNHLRDVPNYADYGYEEFHGNVPPFCCLSALLVGEREERNLQLSNRLDELANEEDRSGRI
jgi:hypothetical protein